nr:sodium channel protein Nach-like isoform X1 [Osmia lignaria]
MKYNYKPSLAELRSSMKYRSKEYLLENTLHGFRYFADPTRPKWERIIWFLLTLASIISVFVIIVIIWDKFKTEPTITGFDTLTEHITIDFPKVFICFGWNQLSHLNLPKNEMYIYEQLYNWTWEETVDFGSLITTYGNKNNFRSIFEKMVPSCNDMIKNCAYKNAKIPCNELFTPMLVTVGACCVLNTVEPLRITDSSLSLEFEVLSLPFRLYFTEPNFSSPLPGERPIMTAYFPLDLEFIPDITYTTPDIRYLLLHQRECLYKQEGASLDECEINCIIDMIFKQCNCLPWFLPSVDKAECSLSKYSCLSACDVDLTRCNCWLSCDHTSYTVRTVTKSASNMSKIMLRNWVTTLYIRQMRFGFLDLLVSFGGIASLFVGYSLLTSIELGYYFSLKTYCGAVIQSSRKQYNIIKVHVVEKVPPKVDVNPRYYQYID